MAITVCIEIDDDGSISVGTEPEAPEAEGAPGAASPTGMTDLSQPQPSDEPTEDAGMQPAQSIDDALNIARGLLRAASQGGGATIGGEPGGEGAQASADAAFKSRRGYKAGM